MNVVGFGKTVLEGDKTLPCKKIGFAKIYVV